MPSPVTPTTNGTSQKQREKKIPSLKKPAELVTLYAGERDEKFVVHKEFACFYSPVLKAAFESDFIEGQTQTYRLEDTTKRALRLLNHWLYTQTLDTVLFEKSLKENHKEAKFRAVGQMQALLELWVLAEKLLIPTLQNMAIIEYNKRSKESLIVPTGSLEYIYNNTSAGCPLRLLIIDQCAGTLLTTSYSEFSDQFPHEMLIELAIRYSTTVREDKRIMAKLYPDIAFAKYLVEETHN